MTTASELVQRMYAAYNRRDADGLLALLTDDVDWPDGTSRLHGKDALRGYWLEQWTRVHTHDEPGEPVELGAGRIAVQVNQTVRTPEGSAVSTARFVHLFQLRDGLTARMDIEPERRRPAETEPPQQETL
ncbi:nuclear transport factor 2 family protein [Paractinoplanes lichenicola]|uniref:Nuclear transport factor 2 family protein n=1 Tax=Paractinoplanes lichenicola TaxID=2802976 RepID=A0ABS1W0J8_9ACTN|nr:nuclear transport factor 2 family protein [Actinoplanes lichenicola]MBL7260257.1 nuclear transport factor 2 family protein [Actinoplanes lichenicola]